VNNNDIIVAYRAASRRLLLLDYDGVLAPIMPLPEQAAPDEATRSLLRRLGADGRTDCAIVSGRYHGTLQEWLGDLPVAFAAEHGLWRKDFGGEWQPTVTVEANWKGNVAAIMKQYVAMLPGSFIEEKDVALVLHYRNVTAPDVDEAVGNLIAELEPLLGPSSLRILHGKKVVEVLPSDVNKGVAASFWTRKKSYDFILAAGDDVTDEALFGAMPTSAFTVKVGEGETVATHRVASQPEFMKFLTALGQTN
jgi:trehalose 6-phosphate synthase/phosphatase